MVPARRRDQCDAEGQSGRQRAGGNGQRAQVEQVDEIRKNAQPAVRRDGVALHFLDPEYRRRRRQDEHVRRFEYSRGFALQFGKFVLRVKR